MTKSLIFATSVVSGLFGAILGLGGGMIITPVLTLAFGLDIRYAIGASVVSIIATSSGAAVAYLRDHLTNVRIGMLLEVGTTVGALTGALLAAMVDSRWLFVLFGVLTLYMAGAMYRGRRSELPAAAEPDALARRLQLSSSYYDQNLNCRVNYSAQRPAWGVLAMGLAGLMGGLLGIGAGAFKVLGMDQIMRLPMKVSSATSNFMIGVTAAASAAVYFARGQVDPTVTAPVTLGVLLGAILGSRVMVKLHNRTLRLAFIPVLLWIGGQMIWKGWHA